MPRKTNSYNYYKEPSNRFLTPPNPKKAKQSPEKSKKVQILVNMNDAKERNSQKIKFFILQEEEKLHNSFLSLPISQNSLTPIKAALQLFQCTDLKSTVCTVYFSKQKYLFICSIQLKSYFPGRLVVGWFFGWVGGWIN